MISDKDLNTIYAEAFKECKTLEDEVQKYKSLKCEHTNLIRQQYCNMLLYSISQGFTSYEKADFEKHGLIKLYLELVEFLPKEYSYCYIIYYFFKRKNDICLSEIKKYLHSNYKEFKSHNMKPDDFFNESILVDEFFEPIKQGFNGFWSSLAEILRQYPSQNGIPELCEAISKYYSSENDESRLELLTDMRLKYPDLILIKELIGYTYYNMNMWNNTIAYFEDLENNTIFFRKIDVYFMLAWSYGKIKDYKTEENFYKQALEITPDNVPILNNIGYCLYKQKKYSEAKIYFEKCLHINEKYYFAANNYIRTLIALGRNKDAKLFLKSSKSRISKDIKRRVEKSDNTNARIIKKDLIEKSENQAEELLQENTINMGMKCHQFSKEKLLEDELTARIESGMEVFGLKLKMYKRKGVYGRQFIIPIGRLDLLCEDEKGNLYIIELKKDQGYGDVYKQIVQYIEWFEQNEIFKNKKVNGIICLNSPNQELEPVDTISTT